MQLCNSYTIRNFTLATTRIYLVVQVKPNSPVGQLSGSIPEAGPHVDKVWTRLRSDLVGTSQPLATVTIPQSLRSAVFLSYHTQKGSLSSRTTNTALVFLAIFWSGMEYAWWFLVFFAYVYRQQSWLTGCLPVIDWKAEHLGANLDAARFPGVF